MVSTGLTCTFETASTSISSSWSISSSSFLKKFLAFSFIFSSNEAKAQFDGDKVAARIGKRSNSVAFSSAQTSKNSFKSVLKKVILTWNIFYSFIHTTCIFSATKWQHLIILELLLRSTSWSFLTIAINIWPSFLQRANTQETASRSQGDVGYNSPSINVIDPLNTLKM